MNTIEDFEEVGNRPDLVYSCDCCGQKEYEYWETDDFDNHCQHTKMFLVPNQVLNQDFFNILCEYCLEAKLESGEVTKPKLKDKIDFGVLGSANVSAPKTKNRTITIYNFDGTVQQELVESYQEFPDKSLQPQPESSLISRISTLETQVLELQETVKQLTEQLIINQGKTLEKLPCNSNILENLK